tara:strand:- start:39 stop:446 length:408 start_codon:yes stop_codon:yes gene_type:complete
MESSKYFDNQVIRIGIIVGLIGGGLMVSLRHINLGLYHLHGYLFIINYLLNMIVGLIVYKKLKKGNTTYLKRLTVGFFIFSVTTVFFIFSSFIFNQYGSERTLQDYIFVPLIGFSIGLILSSLLAISFKAGQWGK